LSEQQPLAIRSAQDWDDDVRVKISSIDNPGTIKGEDIFALIAAFVEKINDEIYDSLAKCVLTQANEGYIRSCVGKLSANIIQRSLFSVEAPMLRVNFYEFLNKTVSSPNELLLNEKGSASYIRANVNKHKENVFEAYGVDDESAVFIKEDMVSETAATISFPPGGPVYNPETRKPYYFLYQLLYDRAVNQGRGDDANGIKGAVEGLMRTSKSMKEILRAN